MFSPLNQTELPILRGALAALGCGDSEIRAYEVLLDSGHRPASYIARKVGLNRVYTYDVLSTLEQRGIVYSYEKNSVTHYATLPPKEIVHHLQSQEERLVTMRTELNDIVSQLTVDPAGPIGVPTFSVLRGDDAVLKAIRRLDIKREEPIEGILDASLLSGAEQPKWISHLRMELQKHRGMGQIAVLGKKTTESEKHFNSSLSARYFDLEPAPYQIILSQSALVLVFDAEDTAIVVPDGMFVRLFRWFYRMVWNSSALVSVPSDGLTQKIAKGRATARSIEAPPAIS